MKKFRIIEKSDLNGNIKFYPQQKKFLLWFPFIKTDVFPVEICFDSYQSAKLFIDRQISQPKEKVYYIN